MGTLGPFSLFLLFALSQQNVFVAASDVLELRNSDFDYTVAEYETVGGVLRALVKNVIANVVANELARTNDSHY